MAGIAGSAGCMPVRVRRTDRRPRPGSPSGSATPSTAAPAWSTSASATRAAPTRRRRPPSSMRSRRGVVVIASAGNAGTEARSIPARTPACSPSGRATTLTTSISGRAAAPGWSLTAPGCQMSPMRRHRRGRSAAPPSHRPCPAVAGLLLSQNPSLTAPSGRDCDGRDRAPRQGRRLRADRPGGRLEWLRPLVGAPATTVAGQPPPLPRRPRRRDRSGPAVHTADAVRDGHVPARLPLDLSCRAGRFEAHC